MVYRRIPLPSPYRTINLTLSEVGSSKSKQIEHSSSFFLKSSSRLVEGVSRKGASSWSTILGKEGKKRQQL